MRKKNREQNWFSIDKIHEITEVVSDEIANTEEYLLGLTENKNIICVMGDNIINRSFRLYKEQMIYVECFERQVSRWEKEVQSDEQKKDVESFALHTKQFRELTEKVILLLKELNKGSKDKKLDSLKSLIKC